MGFDFGALARNMGVPQSTVGVDDLSPHVDGGQSATGTVPMSGSSDMQSVIHVSAAIVIAAIVLLWFFGGIAFRGLPSI